MPNSKSTTPAPIDHHDGLEWTRIEQPFSLQKYTNFGSFLNGIGPYQAFVTYTHRLFTTIARLPFPAQSKVENEIQTSASQSLFRSYGHRIV